ncbi:MAG TPA: hypothetical protein VIS78_13445 [Blastocatellia bacterium]
MTKRNTFTIKNSRRARVSALVCLCLVLHALFVCLTHHHDAPLAAPTVLAASDGHAPVTGDTGSDAGCLSCRLQRHFIADPHTPALGVEPPVEVLLCVPRLAAVHTRQMVATLFGRAPPLV